MNLSNADRQHIWRLRESGELPPIPRCPQCGGRMYKSVGPYAGHGVCARCWAKTEEGKAYEREKARERMRRLRKEKKAND